MELKVLISDSNVPVKVKCKWLFPCTCLGKTLNLEIASDYRKICLYSVGLQDSLSDYRTVLEIGLYSQQLFRRQIEYRTVFQCVFLIH